MQTTYSLIPCIFPSCTFPFSPPNHMSPFPLSKIPFSYFCSGGLRYRVLEFLCMPIFFMQTLVTIVGGLLLYIIHVKVTSAWTGIVSFLNSNL